MTYPVSNIVNTVATGGTSTAPFITIFEPRDPTTNDRNYRISQRWLNTSLNKEWILIGFTSAGGVVQPNWQLLSAVEQALLYLTGNNGEQVPPTAANINILGDGTTIYADGNPATSTITLSYIGPTGGVSSLTATAPLLANGVSGSPETGSVTVSLGTPLIGEYGGTGIDNSGLTIDLTYAGTGYILTSDGSGNASYQAAPATGIQTIDADSGSMSGSIVKISGGSTGLTTTASASTLDITGILVGDNGGTGVDNSGLTINLGSAITGYVLTSDAFGNATWEPAGSSSVTITGDSGSISGSTVTIYANQATLNCGATVGFINSGTTSTLNVTDQYQNTVIGSGSGINSFGTNTNNNVVVGNQSLTALIPSYQGIGNVSIGNQNLTSATTCGRSIAIGTSVFSNIIYCGSNIGIGYSSDQFGNAGVGFNYSNTESGNILINSTGVANDYQTLRIGDSQTATGGPNLSAVYIQGIYTVSPIDAYSPQVMLCDNQGSLTVVPYGAAGTVLTSNLYASPTFQALPSSSVTITGDDGSIAGTSLTIFSNQATLNCGSSVSFINSVTTSTLNVTDSNLNTIFGYSTGNLSLTGQYNSQFGADSFNLLTSGSSNSAVGVNTFLSATSASFNSGIGFGIGGGLATGNYNFFAGYAAGSNFGNAESSNVILSNAGQSGDNNTIRIGTQGSGDNQQNITYIAGITGASPVDANSPQVMLCDNTGNLTVINDTSTSYVLTSNGTNSPTFQAISSSGAITTIDGDSGSITPTSGVVTLSGGTTGLTTNGSGSTLSLTGTLNVGSGGTGASTLTGVLIGNGTSPFTASAITQYYALVGGASNAITSVTPSTPGFVFTSNGVSSDPSFQSLSSIGAITAIDGDSGSITPTSGVVTLSGGTTGLTTSGSGPTLNLTGTLNVGSGGTGASTLTGVLIGNGTSPFTASAITQHYALVGGASNAITSVTPSTSGFVFTSNGVSSDPSFQSISASGAITTIDGDSGSITPTAGVVTLSGGTTGLTTSGSGSTLNLTGTLKLANGGTNASLTASNGGIFYSTATSGAILAGTATASQVLLSGSSTTPAWSTATYPATTTINQLLYSSAANTIAGVTAGNYGVLISSSSGVPSWLANGTTGQLLAATTSSTPSWASATTTPTASTYAGWDANSNMSANNFNTGYATTVTAAGTTTLTVSSAGLQYFTGSTTQTVKLPVTSTLTLGMTYQIVNNSTSSVFVQSSGGNTVKNIAGSSSATYTCILTSGTTAASWSYQYNRQSIQTAIDRINIQSFTSSGTYTPTATTQYVVVECWGGGAAGGAGYSGTAGGCGGGGGAGGYSRLVATASTIGSSQTVTINGAAASTTFGSLITCNGGSAGSAGTSTNGGAGGAGGTASGGTVNITGGSGNGGGIGTAAVSGSGGSGGNTSLGGAGGGSSGSTAGLAASANSGAGGGGGGTAATGGTGGAGSSGIVIVTEYLSQ